MATLLVREQGAKHVDGRICRPGRYPIGWMVVPAVTDLLSAGRAGGLPMGPCLEQVIEVSRGPAAPREVEAEQQTSHDQREWQ
jgi:hypothetical protein